MSIPVDNTWTLTFDEEFNGTSVDTNVWETNWLGNPGAITKPINSQELAAYDPAQVSVYGGSLHLTAIESPVTVNGIDYQYRSGIVESHDSFSQTYGYFEARIFLPGTNGQIADWPAFWTDGEHWPTDGEMDIMEGLGGTAAYHYHSSGGAWGQGVKGDYTGWHTFGALWEPGKVSFYYDNQYVGAITSGITDSPNYLILNLGIGIHSILQVPAEMLVDWVHVYSIDPSAVPVDPQANYTGPGGLDAGQSLVGTASNDQLVGTSGTDNIYGLAGNDTLSGKGGTDEIIGDAGKDRLVGGGGADYISGGDGNDLLAGGGAADTLDGGAGADIFRYSSVNDSLAAPGKFDTIVDFSHTEHDVIDLRRIDANAVSSGSQAFNFIGTGAFTHHAGELRYEASGTDLYVYGDVNGDGVADFELKLLNVASLVAHDFIL
jgi:Ca2+-binding RTX toxin-like protein